LSLEKFMSWISLVLRGGPAGLGWIKSLVFDGMVWCGYGSVFGPLAG